MSPGIPSIPSRNLRSVGRPIRTYTHRLYRNAVFAKLPILSNAYRPFLTLARSNTHTGYGSVNCCFSPLSVWIAGFGVSSKITTDQGRLFESQLLKELLLVARYQTFTHDGLSSRVQWDGRAPSTAIGSDNQMPRYEQLCWNLTDRTIVNSYSH